jgi:hypothetical protein
MIDVFAEIEELLILIKVKVDRGGCRVLNARQESRIEQSKDGRSIFRGNNRTNPEMSVIEYTVDELQTYVL